MNNNDIKTAMAALQEAMCRLEEEYTENGGEVTEETEAQEAHIEALKTLLEGEGIDSLGRWLKSKEDLIKTLKAERDSVNRQIKATENSIEYIKSEIYNVLVALGKDKVKGTFYSFAPVISRKTEVDKEILEDKYLAEANMAMEKILPSWVTFKLSASIKAVPEGYETPTEFRVVETPSCKFVKPRAGKED
jgi:hypothetical protein